jgi:uncharacterized membrane protein (UPF0127 family)
VIEAAAGVTLRRVVRRMGQFVIFVAMLACACSDSGDGGGALLPTAEITVSGGAVSETLIVELATTPAQHQQGLMFRQEMAENRGMLFIFDRDRSGGFWMRNTYLPLDIAYIGADGTVLEIVQGKPLDETILTPRQPYRYVLEVNAGWFERHGLGVGAKITIPDAAALPQAPAPTATSPRAR